MKPRKNFKNSERKICVKCGVELTENNQYSGRGYNYICKECESIRAKKRYKKDHKKIRQQQKQKNWSNKLKVIEAYGGKCVCCNETIPEFLTIDHIKNNGKEDRADGRGSGEKLYRWLIANNFPKEEYQLLCYNCNCAKGFFGYCPHNPTNINFIDNRRKKII